MHVEVEAKPTTTKIVSPSAKAPVGREIGEGGIASVRNSGFSPE